MADQPQVAEGFGDRVRELRAERGYTQTLLAKIVGVALSAVTDWETGKRLPRDTAVLIRLAAALNTSLDYLLLDVEGEHDALKRRLQELLDDLTSNRLRYASADPAIRRSLQQGAVPETPAATADVVSDARTQRSRRQRGA